MGLMALFIRMILDDRPDDILKYAGTFFDRAELRDVVTEAIEREKENAKLNLYLKDLISGKTLIEWLFPITSISFYSILMKHLLNYSC